MHIHFIQQDPWVEPGEYLAWAQRHGFEVSFTRCWLGESVPETVDADLLVVLGGWQCPATTTEECPTFDAAAEIRLIRRCVERGMAVVGVCLGAQLVGEAMGAPYEHSPEREVGPVPAWLTEEGRRDPLLADFPAVFDAGAWHNDMPGLTEDCAVLAASEGCPRQIVRYTPLVYGLQTHMEFTHEIIVNGLRDCDNVLGEGRFIQSIDELLAYDYAPMNALLSRFLDRLLEAYRA